MYYRMMTNYPLTNMVEYHIVHFVSDGITISFPDNDSNNGPERLQYLAWLEEGNVPEEWNPEGAE